MRKDFGFRYRSTFVCLWWILSNYGLIGIKRFVSRFSLYFHLYLMLHTCVKIFDVTENLKNFLVFGWTKQGLYELTSRSVLLDTAGVLVWPELRSPMDERCRRPRPSLSGLLTASNQQIGRPRLRLRNQRYVGAGRHACERVGPSSPPRPGATPAWRHVHNNQPCWHV